MRHNSSDRQTDWQTGWLSMQMITMWFRIPRWSRCFPAAQGAVPAVHFVPVDRSATTVKRQSARVHTIY